jgi:hypothetical protein
MASEGLRDSAAGGSRSSTVACSALVMLECLYTPHRYSELYLNIAFMEPSV